MSEYNEKIFYPSINCKYCKHNCLSEQKNADPTYHCCYNFFPREISEPYYYNSDDYESAIHDLAATIYYDNKIDEAKSNNPQKRADGTSVIVLDINRTPKLYKYLYNRYKRKKRIEKINRIKSKIISALIPLVIIVAIIFLSSIGIFIYKNNVYTVEIYTATDECKYLSYRTGLSGFLGDKYLAYIDEGTKIAIICEKKDNSRPLAYVSERDSYYIYNGEKIVELRLSKNSNYTENRDIDGIEYVKTIFYWDFKLSKWWE